MVHTHTYDQIGREMGISRRTVKAHIEVVKHKMGVHTLRDVSHVLSIHNLL